PPDVAALVTRHDPLWTRRLLRALDALRRRIAARPGASAPSRTLAVPQSSGASPAARQAPDDSSPAPECPRPAATPVSMPPPTPASPEGPALGPAIGRDGAPDRDNRAHEANVVPPQA